MAGAIMLASVLSQYITIACPLCGYRKRVQRRPAARRVCPRCRKYFDDPLTPK